MRASLKRFVQVGVAALERLRAGARRIASNLASPRTCAAVHAAGLVQEQRTGSDRLQEKLIRELDEKLPPT